MRTLLLTVLCLFIASPTLAVGTAMTGGASQGIGLVTTFVVAGQSNGWGSGGNATVSGSRWSPSSARYPQGRVMKYNRSAFDLQATDSAAFWPSTAYEASHWPWFVRKWVAETSEPVDLVFWPIGASCLCADDGTGDEPQWDPDGVAPVGDRYTDMITMLTATHKNGPSLKAVLWDQGECETTSATTPTGNKDADYQAALENLADNIWADLGVPMIVSPVSMKTGTIGACPTPAPGGGHALVHTGTDAAIAAHDHIIGTVDKDALTFDDNDCAHVYDVRALGELWFDAVDTAGFAK